MKRRVAHREDDCANGVVGPSTEHGILMSLGRACLLGALFGKGRKQLARPSFVLVQSLKICLR